MALGKLGSVVAQLYIHSDTFYELMPYEEIDEEEYLRRVKEMKDLILP